MQHIKTIIQYITVVLICCGCQFTNSQEIDEDEVPKAVLMAFSKIYPNEKEPDWEIDSNGFYEAQFKSKGEKYRADFSKSGQWIETENSIKIKELPKAIREAIKANYGSEEITEVEHVKSASKGEFYDVEFKRKGKNMDVMFRADGSIL